MKFIFVFCTIFTLFFSLLAQPSGNGVFVFSLLPQSAHVSSLGGNNISTVSNELSFVFSNPALLTDSMLNTLIHNSSRYFADIYYGNVAFATKFKEKKTFIGMQYFNYGKFKAFDEVGVSQGHFYAADYMLTLSYAKSLIDSNIQVGFSIKPIYSVYESYTSFGIVSDVGLNMFLPEPLWSFSVAWKNIGYQIKNYYDEKEPITSDLQVGITKKLRYAPLRISLTFNHLNNWTYSKYYFDKKQNQTNTFNQEEQPKIKKIEKYSEELLRHLIVSSDIVLTRNLYVALGYNFQRRRELGIDSRMSTTGLSWGFGIKIYRFQLHFARARYHLAGSSNMLTISSNLNEWYKKH